MEGLKGKYIWDEEAAGRAVRFIEGNLKHWKAPFAGRPFVLSDWQRDEIVKPLWGLRREDGTRVFRKVYIQIPRKNGKTALAAALLLLVLCLDGEGLELYCAATKRDQAMIVFKDCLNFVKASPKLRKRLVVKVGSIEYPEKNCTLAPLSADHNSLDGLNVAAAVIDELHAHKSADLYDVIQTATGAREQPLVICITTAGQNRQGVCFDQYEYAGKILQGAVEDDEQFAYVVEADEGLKWDDPEAYRQANPNMGISIREDYLEAERKRALEIPSYRKSFQRYHLDRWVAGGVDSWLSGEAWQRNERPWKLKDLDMRGRVAYGGLDLSTTTDLTALALAFPWKEGIRLWVRFYCPEATIEQRSREDRVPYDVWRDEGWLVATPGEVVDYRVIVRDVLALRGLVDLRGVTYDKWNATSVYVELEEEGVEMWEFIQGLQSFHPVCQAWEKRVIEGSLWTDGNPIMRWMASNVKVKRDASDKMRPVKDYKASKERIDGIIAGLMAVDGLMRGEAAEADDWLPPPGFRSAAGV
jgi:phage terminase large subunit-like protein